jgi:hypothetical protein
MMLFGSVAHLVLFPSAQENIVRGHSLKNFFWHEEIVPMQYTLGYLRPKFVLCASELLTISMKRKMHQVLFSRRNINGIYCIILISKSKTRKNTIVFGDRFSLCSQG